MQPIELSFEYTAADYQEFLRNYFWKSQSRFYGILILLVLAVLAFTQEGSVFSWQFLLSAILPVGMFVGLWFGIMRYSGRRAFQMNLQMQEQRTGQIDAEKISIVGQTFSSEFKWEGVQRVEETQNLFLIYNSKSSAVILPKRDFAPAQIQDFKKLVSEIPGLAATWVTS